MLLMTAKVQQTSQFIKNFAVEDFFVIHPHLMEILVKDSFGQQIQIRKPQ